MEATLEILIERAANLESPEKVEFILFVNGAEVSGEIICAYEFLKRKNHRLGERTSCI